MNAPMASSHRRDGGNHGATRSGASRAPASGATWGGSLRDNCQPEWQWSESQPQPEAASEPVPLAVSEWSGCQWDEFEEMVREVEAIVTASDTLAGTPSQADYSSVPHASRLASSNLKSQEALWRSESLRSCAGGCALVPEWPPQGLPATMAAGSLIADAGSDAACKRPVAVLNLPLPAAAHSLLRRSTEHRHNQPAEQVTALCHPTTGGHNSSGSALLLAKDAPQTDHCISNPGDSPWLGLQAKVQTTNRLPLLLATVLRQTRHLEGLNGGEEADQLLTGAHCTAQRGSAVLQPSLSLPMAVSAGVSLGDSVSVKSLTPALKGVHVRRNASNAATSAPASAPPSAPASAPAASAPATVPASALVLPSESMRQALPVHPTAAVPRPPASASLCDALAAALRRHHKRHRGSKAATADVTAGSATLLQRPNPLPASASLSDGGVKRRHDATGSAGGLPREPSYGAPPFTPQAKQPECGPSFSVDSLGTASRPVLQQVQGVQCDATIMMPRKKRPAPSLLPPPPHFLAEWIVGCHGGDAVSVPDSTLPCPPLPLGVAAVPQSACQQERRTLRQWGAANASTSCGSGLQTTLHYDSCALGLPADEHTMKPPAAMRAASKDPLSSPASPANGLPLHGKMRVATGGFGVRDMPVGSYDAHHSASRHNIITEDTRADGNPLAVRQGNGGGEGGGGGSGGDEMEALAVAVTGTTAATQQAQPQVLSHTLTGAYPASSIGHGVRVREAKAERSESPGCFSSLQDNGLSGGVVAVAVKQPTLEESLEEMSREVLKRESRECVRRMQSDGQVGELVVGGEERGSVQCDVDMRPSGKKVSKERQRRGRINEGLRRLRACLPADMAARSTDTASMIEAVLQHVQEMEEHVRNLELTALGVLVTSSLKHGSVAGL